MWRARRAFWNWLSARKFLANDAQKIPVPTDEVRRLNTIPMRVRFPGIPIDRIPVGDHVPKDENQWSRLAFCRFQSWLYRVFPPGRPGLPSISADPFTALRQAYRPVHRRVFPEPVLPEEYQAPVDLGQLAVAGPYSHYLQAVRGSEPDTSYDWDFRHLAGYEHHHGLRSLGVRVGFELDADERGVSAVEIDCELGHVTPDDPDWDEATRLALAAATNHLTLVRHFTGIHLATMAQCSVAMRNCLPADHRLRRLLWPHLWGSQYSSELVTKVMAMKGGDYDSVFSFTHEGLCQLLEDSYENFDIAVYDPDLDAEERGLKSAPFLQPALENRRAHFDVMHSHTQRYLHGAYHSDAALRADGAVMAFVADLNRRLPGGVDHIVGNVVTVEGLARLAAVLVYVGSVEHEIVGSGLWNYQIWPHVQPTRVWRNGRRMPVDVYQRLVNFNFMLNVSRAPLVQDLTHLAVDRDGADAFRQFQDELRALQITAWAEPYAAWQVTPDILEVSPNG